MSAISDGKRFVILGDFGAGKSMTLRHIYYYFKDKYINKHCRIFPIHINLRDHLGQSDPTELLHRHSTRIGFEPTSHLVRAWRAGLGFPILDGFDEIAPSGWFSIKKKLRHLRFEAMTLVRRFIEETPRSIPIIIAGRNHYFDGIEELQSCLGTKKSFTHENLSDLSSDQIRELLEKQGVNNMTPDWLPPRPLLISYLACSGILRQLSLNQADAYRTQADAWNKLLSMICEREAKSNSRIDANTVREIIERISTSVRRQPGGLGPILQDEINKIFRIVVGYPPDDEAMVLLLRLPGLGAPSLDDSSRSFVDPELAEAAQAGDLCRYVNDPFAFDTSDLLAAQTAAGGIAADVAALMLQQQNVSQGQIMTAVERASDTSDGGNLTADLVAVAACAEIRTARKVTIVEEAFINYLSIEDSMLDSTKLQYKNCIIAHLVLPSSIPDQQVPSFLGCYIALIDGRIGKADLPTGKFDDCNCVQFTPYEKTTRSLLASEHPDGVKVLLTILKKLFLQKGAGRKNSALYRGLDHRYRRHVDDILTLIEREDIAQRSRVGSSDIWYPNRAYAARAMSILASPSTSTDVIVMDARILDCV